MDNERPKPIIYTGLEGAAQWQIAIRYLHQIPNDEYEILMEKSKVCHRCDRKFIKLFSFFNKNLKVKLYICHACIYDLGDQGVLDYLYQVEKRMVDGDENNQ